MKSHLCFTILPIYLVKVIKYLFILHLLIKSTIISFFLTNFGSGHKGHEYKKMTFNMKLYRGGPCV